MSARQCFLFIIIIAGLLFIPAAGYGIESAAERETGLFNKGYEYLFSYQPAKAAEAFRLFLSQFPESSARDAAMFWLGKTLINLNLYDEAEQTFHMLQKEFQDSPFIVFIPIETEEIAKIRSNRHIGEAKGPSEPQKSGASKEGKDKTDAEDGDGNITKILPTESLPEKISREERDRVSHQTNQQTAEGQSDNADKEDAVLQEMVSKLQADNAALIDRVVELEDQAEQRARDMNILNSYFTLLMFQKKDAHLQKHSTGKERESDGLKTEVNMEKTAAAGLRSQPAAIHEQEKEPQRSNAGDAPPVRKSSALLLRIMNKDHLISEVIGYQASAMFTLRLLNIKDLVWKVNNPIDDFIAEELLNEAARINSISIDTKKQKELIQRHKLSPAEAAYLERIMLIGRYLDAQYVDMPVQQWIEVLSVDYKPGNAASKTVLAAELQQAARSGASFQEIADNHPDGIKFFRLTPQEFSLRFKDKTPVLQKLNAIHQETAVIWSKRGYLLIKPVSKRAEFDTAEELPPAEQNKLRAFVVQRISELRKEAGL